MSPASSPPRQPSRTGSPFTHIAPIVMRLMRTTNRIAIPRGTVVETVSDGPDLVATDYWRGPLAARGVVYCSVHESALRVLLPPSLEHVLPEMRTGREVLVSRGPWPELEQEDALELLWEDGSAAPFAIQISVRQCQGLEAFGPATGALTCRVYTLGEAGAPHLAGTWRARFRRVESLPCLRPWGTP